MIQKQLAILRDALHYRYEEGDTQILYEEAFEPDMQTSQCLMLHVPGSKSATVFLFPDGTWKVVRGKP